MAKRGRAKPAADDKSKIRIRMYNVGFGDCFLLLLPVQNGVRKIVIDCGSLKNKHKSIREISDQLIEDCREADGKARIDILIVSHRHADHISGFTNPEWSKVEVREIWMPWIESRDDPSARGIRETQHRAAVALAQAVIRFGLNPELADVALNAQSNDDALDVLHGGFALKVKPRFIPKGTGVVEKIETPLLPGIDVFALGPPHNESALKDAKPPKEQSLLTGFLNADVDDPTLEKFRPLSPDWIEENPSVLFDQREIHEAVSQHGRYDLLAAKIDAELNNTSLIIIFSVGEDYLLFPGDAQWGPWELVLADQQAVDLLNKVTFLKVGHHASHNASPTSLIREHLGRKNKREKRVHAMISMTPYSKWKDIPHKPLLEELKKKKFPFVVSDELVDRPGFTRKDDLWFEFTFD
jgi:beta-lactamase superfamily II metal-dependent hydrolase